MKYRTIACWRPCSKSWHTWIYATKLETLGLMTESLRLCVQARKQQHNINYPAYDTWTADFMLRQSESRAFLGKYLNYPHVLWKYNRHEFMVIAGMILIAKLLANIKQQSDVGCRLCRRAREQRSAITDNLPVETYGTWVADSMLKQDAGKFILEQCWSDKKSPFYYIFTDANI